MLTHTQWDLICDKSSLTNISQSMFFIGAMLGAWIWGTVADRIGRRKVFFLSILCTVILGLGCSLSPNFYIFAIFRLLVAFSTAGVILSSFVHSVEIIGTEYRTAVTMGIFVYFGLCYPLVALSAYLITNWRMFCIVNSLSGLLFFLLWR